MLQIRQLIREIIPVIFGVLIALIINNWNEDRKDRKYLNRIYNSIEAELIDSNKDIEQKLPLQQGLVDNLIKHLNDDSMSLYDIINASNGFHGPNIKLHTWRAIANSKIELIEFTKLSALSEIEISKRNLEQKKEKIIDFTVQNIKTTDPEKKEIFMLLNQELISTEKYLQYEISEFLNK